MEKEIIGNKSLPSDILIYVAAIKSNLEGKELTHQDCIKIIREYGKNGVDISNFNFSGKDYSSDMMYIASLLWPYWSDDISEICLNKKGFEGIKDILKDFLSDPKYSYRMKELLKTAKIEL